MHVTYNNATNNMQSVRKYQV